VDRLRALLHTGRRVPLLRMRRAGGMTCLQASGCTGRRRLAAMVRQRVA